MSRARDSRAVHRRRTELARHRGFRSYYEQSKAPSRITGPSTLAQLPDAAQDRRAEALKVVAHMRREGLDLAAASRRERVASDVVRYYARDALTRSGERTVARPADRLYRRMTIISGGQIISVDVRGSRQATLVSNYWNLGVNPYLEPDADEAGLRGFRGSFVGRFELETDTDVLDEMARQGAFDFDSIYRLVA
jgi:hypothetical protein